MADRLAGATDITEFVKSDEKYLVPAADTICWR
jgi:hypothetical protein